MGIDAQYAGTTGVTWIKQRLLDRGWNVATPMVDVGDDLFVFRRAATDLARLQIKTGSAEDRDYGYSTRFMVRRDRIHASLDTPLFFLFLVDLGDDRGPTLTFPQSDFRDLVDDQNMGSETSETALQLYLGYRRGDDGIEKILCSDIDVTEYADDLSYWPPLEIPAAPS